MASSEMLGQLSGLHEMMRGVLESMPTADDRLSWCLRRASFRFAARRDERYRFAGVRLVLPPGGKSSL